MDTLKSFAVLTLMCLISTPGEAIQIVDRWAGDLNTASTPVQGDDPWSPGSSAFWTIDLTYGEDNLTPYSASDSAVVDTGAGEVHYFDVQLLFDADDEYLASTSPDGAPVYGRDICWMVRNSSPYTWSGFHIAESSSDWPSSFWPNYSFTFAPGQSEAFYMGYQSTQIESTWFMRFAATLRTPASVPDGGSTLLLIGLALPALGVLGRILRA